MSTQPNLRIDLGNLELSEMHWRMIGEYRLREMLLFLFAALQALWCLFMLDGPPFVLRLMLAAVVGGATILLALARPHKRTVEDWLLTILYYHIQPKRRVHQTATRDDLKASLESTESASQAPVPNERGNSGTAVQKRKSTSRVRVGLPTLIFGFDAADPGLVMAVFFGLLMFASLIAFVGRGGHF